MPYVCLLLQGEVMVRLPVLCPHCHSDQVLKGGKTTAGHQRSQCQNTDCPHESFQLDLVYTGRAPALKERMPLPHALRRGGQGLQRWGWSSQWSWTRSGSAVACGCAMLLPTAFVWSCVHREQPRAEGLPL
jgi:InsA N-terminal domain